MELDLSPFFKTKIQATDFANRLATISQGIYQSGFQLESALLEQFGLQKKDRFLILLQENKVSLDKPTELKSFLDTLMEKAATQPVMSITLAFEPSEKVLQSLSEWFVLNIKQQMVFDVHVDSNIIAGAAISFNGKRKDFSIRPVFDAVIAEALANNNNLPAPDSKEPPPPYGKHQTVDAMHMGR